MSFNIANNGSDLFDELDSLDERVAEIEENGASAATGVTHDVPETLGEYYCVRKAQEMIEASAYLVGAIAAPNHAYSAGDTLKGLPYSSTRKENTFVPNHVSFETYFTALSDPNSYAYTVHPHSGAYEYLYYGAVCGVFACYCLGITMRHTNWDMFGIPEIEKVAVQDAQSMRIGYLVNTAKNGHTHVRVCIGVTRNNGVVTHVLMAESTDPVTRAVEYTAEEFNATLTDYTILKYNKLEENTYEPLSSAYRTPIYNKNLMPKKGNKANWSTTEDVIIDVLDKGSYTNYVVERDGIQHSTAAIGSGTTINLGHLPFGKYKMYFVDGSNNKSGCVEWIVVDMHMTVTARSGGIIRFAFSSANATPVACCWGRPNDYMLNLVYDVDKEDIQKGYKDTELSTAQMANYGVTGYDGKTTQYDMYHTYYTTSGNKIRPRMFFKTEFGIITTDWGTDSDNITYID